jgi:hypothetical protein
MSEPLKSAMEVPASSTNAVTASTAVLLDDVDGDAPPPTWKLTFKRAQKMCITFFAVQAFIKLCEGKADDAKGQAERMESMVDKMVADWVEAKGLICIQNVENSAICSPCLNLC